MFYDSFLEHLDIVTTVIARSAKQAMAISFLALKKVD